MEKSLRIKKLEKLKAETKPYKQEDIIYKGQRRLMDVFEIPTEFLIYNKYNGRILSMVKSFEMQFRNLNPELEEDKEVIEGFLWESKPDRNRTTLADLKQYGQKRVGIITKDGIIIDGNRRASLINRDAKEGKKAPVYFKAVILDDTLDDNPLEIMRLETTYQMGEDEKLDYNPIEKYLKCKDLIAIGFDEGEIANMMRESESQIKEWLNIMALMDNYLEDLGYHGIYTRLDKREGQFVDLSKYLRKYEAGTSLADWNYQRSDISDLKAICFDYIRAMYEGKDFRAIALPSKKESFFCKEKVWENFRDKHFKTIDAINKKEISISDLRKREPSGDLSDILKIRDEDWRIVALDSLKENLNKSSRNLDDINEENAPLELLRRAKDTLNSINPKNNGLLHDDNVARLVEDINKIISRLRDIIKKGGE